MNTARDAILVVIAAGMLLAVFWPGELPWGKGRETSDVSADVDSASLETQHSRHVDESTFVAEPRQFSPVEGVPHLYFPLQKGLVWRYLVSGPGRLIDEDGWTLMVTVGERDNEAEISHVTTGDTDSKVSQTVRLVGGALYHVGLPFSGPLRYALDDPLVEDGFWLPDAQDLRLGAVWKRESSYRVTYRTRDKKQAIVELPATMVLTDRFVVEGEDKVIVPAGVYRGLKIQIVSRARLEDLPDNRVVLETFTVKPYKEETVWFVAGVGMVKRRISYADQKKDIVYTLMSVVR